MLRDVALRGADAIDDVLNADFAISKGAENLQTQGMGHCFEGARCTIDFVIASHEDVTVGGDPIKYSQIAAICAVFHETQPLDDVDLRWVRRYVAGCPYDSSAIE